MGDHVVSVPLNRGNHFFIMKSDAYRIDLNSANSRFKRAKLVDTIFHRTEYVKQEVTFKKSSLGKRAIVVGAGLAGLSAARALSDYFDEVLIVDRDELPDEITPRKLLTASWLKSAGPTEIIICYEVFRRRR